MVLFRDDCIAGGGLEEIVGGRETVVKTGRADAASEWDISTSMNMKLSEYYTEVPSAPGLHLG